jgi:predicted acylesterase/phospholipase RssA
MGEDKPIRTLADVLREEFDDLHGAERAPPSVQPAQSAAAAPLTKREQQPIADPSLSTAPETSNGVKSSAPESREGLSPTALEGQRLAQPPATPQPDTDAEAEKLRQLLDDVHRLGGDGRTALCLSGGGVRSAAFNLGVLQGLARLGLLDRFHYLSTVSGGGYIGCWLSAWRYRAAEGIKDVLRGLSWPDRADDGKISPRVSESISNLRRSTNYLTPLKGLLSPDTWATIVIAGRNLILNHLVIVPLVAGILLIQKLILAIAHRDWPLIRVQNWMIESLGALPILSKFDTQVMLLLLLPGVAAVLGWVVFSIARPSWDFRGPSSSASGIPWPHRSNEKTPAQVWAPRLGIASVLAAAMVFAVIVAEYIPQPALHANPVPVNPGQSRGAAPWPIWVKLSIAGAAGAFVSFILAFALGMIKTALCRAPKAEKTDSRQGKGSGRSAHEWAVRCLGGVPDPSSKIVTVPTAGGGVAILFCAAAVAAAAASGAILGIGVEFAGSLPKSNPHTTALLFTCAPLWFVISYLVGDAIYLGLTVRKPALQDGRTWSDRWGDEEREWVARTGGYLVVIALGIASFCALTLFGPELIKYLIADNWGKAGLAILAIASALASIGLGASPISSFFGTATSRSRKLPVRTILSIGTPIFAAVLIIFLSSGLDRLLFGGALLDRLAQVSSANGLFNPTLVSDQLWLLGLALALIVFSWFAASFVNINRFSLYDLYRMRLTREFLGASNHGRKPDFWTGFDENDDIALDQLWRHKKDEIKRLYPVINSALNMAATKKLEWQERKAVSFVFTPRFCGSGATPHLGFRETADYAGGVQLGWAMSVSGAAFSPNAGYTTMPGLALLMTLFNLRLGIWAGNPGKAGEEGRVKCYQQRGPHNAWRPLISEAFARTDDQRKYVYLSDGGHFDNLGVYEMLRRRCRFIVVSDATCDPDYAYADLGSVVRKAAIDFGIRITFKHLDMPRRGETALQGAYSAFAIIEYPEERSPGRRQRGYLLYIKAYYQGLEEPADVRAYAMANPAFPHDSTLNQFFGEAQFESYRVLGGYTVMQLARQSGLTNGNKPSSLAHFFGSTGRALVRSRSHRHRLGRIRQMNEY